MATQLQLGDAAPDFTGTVTDGATVSLAAYRGRKLVLYFYPMDDTPGCTRQACSLRDTHAAIRARGAEILGVSAQDADSHRLFSDKYRLDFPLLADGGLAVAKAYGVAGSGIGGLLRQAAGVAERVTFLIDEAGKIAAIIRDPDCSDHGAEVLALL
ncbi:peroxiredoxin [Dechloromonas sp. ARDL1]|uniref:peroxiredoxin n=1 Tax=Dechloromonas sp. ARDL1 TaxID=3322121 RepID=UPI003DA749AB